MNKVFMCYAYQYIFGEMYNLINQNRDIRLNKEYLKTYKAIEMAKVELTQSLHKEPTFTEICLYLELDEKYATDVLMMSSQILSLDDEYRGLNGNDSRIIDHLGIYDNTDDQILVNESLDTLEPLEQKVIDLRYFRDLTQMETASAMGISQVKVSRLETSSKRKIKEYIAI